VRQMTAMLREDITELAAKAGITLDPDQAALLAAGMSKDGNGKWTRFEVPVPDRSDAVLLARELAGMFLLGERVLDVSGGPDQAEDRARKAIMAVSRSRSLTGRVTRLSRLRGLQSIAAGDGEIRFMSSPSYRGYSADLLVFRPGSDPDDKILAAVLPCAASRPDPQIWRTVT
jgi:hypothetical protein